MNSVNVVVEIQLKRLNERALSTAEPCTCEYVTLLQYFHRGTLSIHWYKYTFSRFLKVAIATSNFMNEVYNGGFSPEFSVSLLKENIALVWD